MKSIDLYSATLSLDRDRVLLVRYKDGIEIDLAESKKLITAALELINENPCYVLMDATDVFSAMDHQSRKYISEHEELNRLTIAQAIVVNSAHIRLLANFYLKFYHHTYPVKMFSNVKAGREWLLSNS